ncbi:MAG: septation protein SepH [Streptosporangiaceae bacterium]
MQELRFVAVSEDGRYAVLAVPGRSARFTLPIDERLRAVALGQTSRLAQYEIEVESPLRPKEIQARIRAGETVEEIADAAGIAVERVRWFEGPVLAERAYMADQAQRASVRRPGDAIPTSPGPRLGEIVTERLKAFGSDPEEAQWDARKLGDGSWQVQLTFISDGRLHTAEWTFDPRRRHVMPADDNASRMSLPGGEPPHPAAPAPGEATVTHLAPRLSSAAGFGAGAMAGGGNGMGSGLANGGLANGGLANGGRARHERPAPMRPTAPEPWIAEPRISEPQAPEPRTAEPWATEPWATEPQVTELQAPEPEVTEPQAPEPREAEAPAAVAPAVPSAPPVVSPAAVAAQVSPPAPARTADAGTADAGTADAGTADSGTADSGTAATTPAAAPEAPAASAAEAPSVSPAAAQAASEQAARQGRKTARGRRSSVPSWDEIMFGNSRQRE